MTVGNYYRYQFKTMISILAPVFNEFVVFHCTVCKWTKGSRSTDIRFMAFTAIQNVL